MKYGRLTVISEIKPRCECRCDCGNVISVMRCELTHGRKRSCGCLKKEKTHNHVGQKFGKLTVQTQYIKNGKSHAMCLCDCGVEIEASVAHLKCGGKKSCGCMRYERLPRFQSAKNILIRSHRNSAKKRNIQDTLTDDEVVSISMLPCYYCGQKFSREVGWAQESGKLMSNGIDRIDSQIGYESGNCVPCCTQCNKMKMDTSESNFLAQCLKICQYQRLEK